MACPNQISLLLCTVGRVMYDAWNDITTGWRAEDDCSSGTSSNTSSTVAASAAAASSGVKHAGVEPDIAGYGSHTRSDSTVSSVSSVNSYSTANQSVPAFHVDHR